MQARSVQAPLMHTPPSQDFEPHEVEVQTPPAQSCPVGQTAPTQPVDVQPTFWMQTSPGGQAVWPQLVAKHCPWAQTKPLGQRTPLQLSVNPPLLDPPPELVLPRAVPVDGWQPRVASAATRNPQLRFPSTEPRIPPIVSLPGARAGSRASLGPVNQRE
jgi:hypothetical protein